MSVITGFTWRRGGGLLSLLGKKPRKEPPKKPKKRKTHNMREWQFSRLHAVIDAEIRQTPISNPPAKWREKFAQLVSGFGGQSAWARAQPEYQTLKEKKLRKYLKKRTSL
jgi:hypothetical protein